MRSPKLLYRFALQCAVLLCCLTGCAVRMQPSNQVFDQVAGRGPLLLVTTDTSMPSNRFFEEHRRSSANLDHLVETQGIPEAISVEREFLQPTKLRLLYIEKSQVFILTRQEEQWFVVGSEPLTETDVASIHKQRARQTQATADVSISPAGPHVTPSMAPEIQPVAHIVGSDFRGRLKPPKLAQEALLTRDQSGNYSHHVSFEGEDLATLAEWYTDDSMNARALAKANRRRPEQPLRRGERIVIPAALMTNPAPLPEAMVP